MLVMTLRTLTLEAPQALLRPLDHAVDGCALRLQSLLQPSQRRHGAADPGPCRRLTSCAANTSFSGAGERVTISATSAE